jgi:hypothetical protein
MKRDIVPGILTAVFLAFCLYFLPSPVVSDSIVVTVDARVNSGESYETVGVAVDLAPGTWRIRVVDDPADTYDGWSPWATDDDPGAAGLPWTYSVRIDEPVHGIHMHAWSPSGQQWFTTQESAWSASLARWTAITLNAPATVYFSFGDKTPQDNRGGASFEVDPFFPETFISEDFLGYWPGQKIWPPTDWMLNGTQGSEWTWGETPYEGTYNTWTDMVSGGQCGLMKCTWSTVPLFDPLFTFWYRGGYDALSHNVAFTVEVSTTRCCPSQFSPIWDSGLFSAPDIFDDYIMETVDLSAYAGLDILIGFRCYYIDDPDYELQLDAAWLGQSTRISCLETERFIPPPPPEFPPSGWSRLIADPDSPNDITGSMTEAHDGIYSARFSSYSSAADYTQYLITKIFYVDPLDPHLTFWYRRHTAGDETFSVGVSAQNIDPLLVSFGGDITDASPVWQQHDEDLSAYAGQSVYVWIRYTSIYQYYLYADLFEFPGSSSESFEGGGPGFPPAGWTAVTHAPGDGWGQGTAHDGSTAQCMESSLEQDARLISPVIDCTGTSDVHLTFWHDFYISSSSGDSYGEIFGSTDNGLTWTHHIDTISATASGDKDYDISSWADGEPQVKIRFRFYSTDGTGEYDVWDIDDAWVGRSFEYTVFFEGFEEEIPAFGFPPTGWYEDVISGDGHWTADNNDSERPPASTGYYARAKDLSGLDFDAGLFTPSMDMSEIGPLFIVLEFDHHFDFWGPGDTAEVRTYSGGVYQETLATFTSDADEHAVLTFDPKPGYPDLSDVQVVFHYQDGALYAEEWCIDNIVIRSAATVPAWLHGTSGSTDPGFGEADSDAKFESGRRRTFDR